MPKLDPKYFAGIFDGEGCVRVSNRYSKELKHKVIQLSLNVSNTNKQLINALKSNFGGYIIIRRRKFPRKITFDWEITGLGNIEKILELISPYLIVKRKHALLALKFINQRKNINYMSPKNRSYSPLTLKTYLEIKQLNQRNKNNAKPDTWLK